MSTAYHPESDGQTEIVNKIIEHYLHAVVHNNPRSWSKLLPWPELWYNTSFHHSIGMTPFQALYGRIPPEVVDYCLGNSNVEAVDTLLQERDRLLAELKINLCATQERMKKYVDMKHQPYKFKIGEWVWLRLQPYGHHEILWAVLD